MKTNQFLSYLRSLKITVARQGDRLQLNAPQGTLTPALRAELTKRKAEILEFLSQANAASDDDFLPILPVSRVEPLPLSFAQARLWFLDQLMPLNPFYNIPSALRLAGELDVLALQQSLNEIIRRHETLRTSFKTVNGQPTQLIAESLKLTLGVIDLQSLPKIERSDLAQELASQVAQQPFDLTVAPLLRVMLVRLAPAEHVLLLVMHHVISDGWSMEVFHRELALLYNAVVTGKTSPLPDLSIQYADFAVWQRTWLEQTALKKQLQYWLQQLADLAVLQLPTDYSRPAAQSFRGAVEILLLSQNLKQGLVKLSQQHGVTLFMTMLAIFKVLLHQYTGQTDIVVGSPIANRNRSEIEPLIGFFVNTLVLRTQCEANLRFDELLTRVQEVTLGAYDHQDLPFERLVEELQPERHLSFNPLVQVVFALQNAPRSELQLTGLQLSQLDIEYKTTRIDMEWHVWEQPQGLQVMVAYATDLFAQQTIHRMLGHFQTLLNSVVANPQQQIWKLPLLSTTEQQQLLFDWNDTVIEYPHHKCIHQLFETQVERTPDAVALVFSDKQLTYNELNVRANKIAHYLQSIGVGPEELVGLCVERSVEMIVGLLGILKAGGTYVPLDPSYPVERLAYILSDAKVTVLLTQQHLVERLSQDSAHVVYLDLDTDAQAIAQHSQNNPSNCVMPQNLAYVMYTSGSTGLPKGVSVVHQGVGRLVKETNYVKLNAEEVFLQLAPIAFDASTFEIWGCLLNGGKLMIIPPHTPSLQELGQAVEQHQVTTLWLTASLFHLMVDEQIKELKNVRQLLAGGDVLSVPHVRRVVEQLPGLTLVNGYGPTENTTFTCCCQITKSSQVQVSVPIGRPIANTQVYLLNEQLQPVPIGVPGELYTSGDGLSRGYCNHPELTADKFIPNPFSNKPGVRLYKTGDRARYLSDGNIEFLGRIDNQVKLRGYRIELGEIESVLNQHPQVRQAVAIVREDSPGQERIVAYCTQDLSNALDTTIESHQLQSQLRSYLSVRLPEYMVPSAIVMLEVLPLTPNGKVDRKALPAPGGRVELSNSFVAPTTQIEQMLTRIWAEVLNREQVGVHDNFFELGGDSILSIQIVAKANQAGLQLMTKQMFEHQTIAKLAAVVGIKTKTHQADEQSLVTGALPLTPIQQWFFNQNLPDPTHWNQAFLFSVPPEISPQILEPVIQQLLVHHDALRLRFERTELSWQQTNVGVEETVPFNSVDLSALPQPEQTSAMESAATQQQASLNLSEGPLVRVAWFFLGNHKANRLLIAIHHLTVDGVSWRIILEDLQTAYEQLSRAEAIVLPPKTTSFKQWSHRLLEYAQSEALIPEMAYWLSESYTRVAGISVDYPGGANTASSAHTVSVSLSVKETQALLYEVPTVYNTQINDVLLTVLGLVLSESTESSSILFNLEGHGRENIIEDVDLSRTVGWFTTIFPVLLELEATDNLVDSLKSVKEQLRRIPNRGIGYGLLRYLRGDAEIASRLEALPQAQVSFNYLGQFDQVLNTSVFQRATESPGQFWSQLGNRSHLLDVGCWVVEGQLKLDWIYSESVHRRSTIEGLAQKFLATLQEMIVQCLSSEAGGWTPSDFPAANFSQNDLDKFIASLVEVEN